MKVIMFTQEFCGPCKRLAPHLEKICTELNIPLEKWDVLEHPKEAAELGITGTPAVFIEREQALTRLDTSTMLVIRTALEEARSG